MKLEFDPRKNDRNIRERGISFESASDFEFDGALAAVDGRHDYGEVRYVAIGLLRDRVHVLCFSEAEAGIRVISLRKANAREVARYAKFQKAD